MFTKKAFVLLTSLLLLLSNVILSWSKIPLQADKTRPLFSTTITPRNQVEATKMHNNMHIESIVEFAVETFPNLSPDWNQAQFEKPLLVYDFEGQPAYEKFFLRRNNLIVGSMDVEVKTGQLLAIGEYGTALKEYPSPPTAEEAMQRAKVFLLRYGSDVSVEEPFLVGPRPEFWLILVRRNGEVIARVIVQGDDVREPHPPRRGPISLN